MKTNFRKLDGSNKQEDSEYYFEFGAKSDSEFNTNNQIWIAHPPGHFELITEYDGYKIQGFDTSDSSNIRT